MVRLSDVAERAGVSAGSVSRVLNGHPGVGEGIRERVLAAAAELGYRPDPAARALRSRRSPQVALVVPDITNPFFAELARELERGCARRGLQLTLRDSAESPGTEARALCAALEHNPTGVVVVPTATTAGLPDTGGVPLVVCDRALPGAAVPAVVADHRQGAAAATAYLLGLGHRRIACVAGPAGTHAADERLAGHLAVAGGAGVSGPVLRGPFDYATGVRAADHLLGLERPPTAIVAGSDQQAIGVLHACLRRGVRVPQEVSVCGFDAVALSALTAPALTTVRQPVAAIAGRALDLLTAPAPAGVVSLPTELLVRDSCAPPPEGTPAP